MKDLNNYSYMNDYKNMLLEILGAINYSEDKEEFMAEFTKNLQLQSLRDLLQASPSDKFEGAKNQLLTAFSDPQNDPQKISEILKDFFSENQVKQSVENAAKEAFTNYITAISDVLSGTQRENLIKVLERYSSSQPTIYNH
jgi:hypothetical protein